MVCPKCGADIQENENFCRVCGSSLSNVRYDNIEYQNNNNDEENLIKAYIGKDSENIYNESFSIWTLLFGSFYVFYRKMWLLGILMTIFYFCVNTFIPEYYYINFLIDLLVSLFFNKYYVSKVKEKVRMIKERNPGYNTPDLMNSCIKEGGTSILSAIGMTILCGLFFTTGVFTYFTDSASNFNDLKYIIPTGFKAGEYNNEETVFYSYTNDKEYCDFSISLIKNDFNTTPNYYLKGLYTYNNNNPIEEEKINKTNWSHTYDTTDKKTTYSYASIKNNYIYDLEFNQYQDNGNCSKAYKNLIASLEFEE